MDSDLEKAGIAAITYEQLRQMTEYFSDERLIGQGSSSRVYLGMHKDRQEIAVKIFLPHFGTDDDMFIRELLNLTRLEHHQNIIRPVAYCNETEEEVMEYNGRMIQAFSIHQAMCLPYAHNGSLRKHISDESAGLDWPTRYRIIKGTSEGLKFLHHDAHMLHLDIKPKNILLYHDMEPKLADFPQSKFFNDGEDEEEATDLYGTLGYVPPEFMIHQLISKKFDIFSLGVVIIKVVAGPQAYARSADMRTRQFIEKVYAKWRRRLQVTFRGSTLDAYCEQVKKCTEIALHCMEPDRNERLDTMDIILALNKTETHKGFEDLKIWKMPFHVLETITNNFNDNNKIGEGSFGSVYKGKLDGKFVAVKKLHPQQHSAIIQTKQLESEEHLKNTEHENIVRLLGICHETKQKPVPVEGSPSKFIIVDVTEFLLCYEFLSNGSLEDKMPHDESWILDWQTRYSVIQGICKGLHYLHQECPDAPIVHRDLKPGNVLLDGDMVPKLGDFGLSRIVPKTQPHLTTPVGSCGYMAPETLYNKSKITPKSDIYSLGVLILEIVTGDRCWSIDYSGKQYIEQVRKARKTNSNVPSTHESPEGRFLKQKENWTGVGLQCVEELPKRRPSIEHILHFLETENANSEDMREGKLSKMSFKELEDIMENFPTQHDESIFGAVYEGTRVNGDDIIVFKLEDQMRPSPAQFEDEVNCMSFKHNNILQLKGYCEEIHDGGIRKRLLCYEHFQGSLKKKIYGDVILAGESHPERLGRTLQNNKRLVSGFKVPP